MSAAALTPAMVWRADQLEAPVQFAWPSGFSALDAELPGAGWPGHALTEILSPHEGTLEWRLLAPLLARLAGEGREALLVGPPQPPHPPGLHAMGLPFRRLVWLRTHSAAERLWCTEQLLRARPGGAVLVWLPDARPAQLRRLQVLAAGCETPVFVCRPDAAAREASAAPLRLRARAMPGWAVAVDILKRRGPPLMRTLHLHAMPAGLQAVLPPRLGTPPSLPESRHVVVRPVPEPAWH